MYAPGFDTTVSFIRSCCSALEENPLKSNIYLEEGIMWQINTKIIAEKTALELVFQGLYFSCTILSSFTA